MEQIWPLTCSMGLNWYSVAWIWATVASTPASTVTPGTCATKSCYMWAVSVAPPPFYYLLPSLRHRPIAQINSCSSWVAGRGEGHTLTLAL